MEKKEPQRPGGKVEPFRLVDRVRDADVLLGRGKRSYNHTGNLRFREMVLLNAATYKECLNKPLRRRIAMTIIERVQSNGGRFLRPHDPEKKNDGAKAGVWVIVPKSIAMTKVKQALRDSGDIEPAQTPLPQRESSSGPVDPRRIPSSAPSQLSLGSDPRLVTRMNPVTSDRAFVDALNQRRLQQLLQARELSITDQLLRQRDQWTSQLASPPTLSDRAHYLARQANESLPAATLQRRMFSGRLQPNVGALNPDLASLMNAASRSLPQHSMLDDLLLLSSNSTPWNAGNHVLFMDAAARRLAVESMLYQQRLSQANPSGLPQSLNQLNRVDVPIPARLNEPNLAAGGNDAPPAAQEQTQDDSDTPELDSDAAKER